MKKGSDSSDTFWPGYVDAISTLVLNLLFVVCIFAIAVFVLGVEASKKQTAAAAAAADVAKTQEGQSLQVAAVAVERTPKSSAEKAIVEKPQEEQGRQVEMAVAERAPEAKTVERVVVAKGGGAECSGISVRFQDDGFALSPEDRQEFAKNAKGLARSNCREIQVIGYADVARSLAKRVAFMRIMSVREALIESGVEPSIIEVKIVDANGEAGGDRIIRIQGVKR